MSENQTVKDYIRELEYQLRDLPADERRGHLDEINDHLRELMAEEGKTEQQIVEAFIAPQQLSKDILSEYKASKQKTAFEIPDYWFGVTIISVFAPFGALALPLMMDTIDIGLYLPFLLQFIVGTCVLFGYYKNKLTNKRADMLRKVGRAMIPLLAIPFALFSIRMMQTGEWSMFNMAYLSCYVLVWLFTYFSIRHLFQRNIETSIV